MGSTSINTPEKIVEILLLGYPVLLASRSGTEFILWLKSASKHGPDSYRVHQCTDMVNQVWGSSVTTKEKIIQQLYASQPTVKDYFEGPKLSSSGKHKCTCKLMDLMARGCQCGGV